MQLFYIWIPAESYDSVSTQSPKSELCSFLWNTFAAACFENDGDSVCCDGLTTKMLMMAPETWVLI